MVQVPLSSSGGHRKVAFLMPSGEVISHDRVIAYRAKSRSDTIDAQYNVGDTFVFESSLRLVQFKELVCVGPFSANVDAAVEALNDCDVAILRGSNYVNPHMDWGNLPEVLERSHVPVVALGIGAQAPRYEPLKLSASSSRLLALIAERSTSVGCRGSFTASILYDAGIKNVVPIGCPSLFRMNDMNIQIRWPPDPLERIGYSITRGFLKNYCDDIARATRIQLETLRQLSESYAVHVLSQGERAEKIYYYRAYDRIEEARQSMQSCGWDTQQHPWLEQLYWRGIFFGVTPADYELMARMCDLVLGFRLHGNIMALSVGKPAIYITFDSRTREIVEHFSIPNHDIMSEREFSLRDWLQQEQLFEEFNRKFAPNYRIMRDFLASNGIRHAMTAG